MSETTNTLSAEQELFLEALVVHKTSKATRRALGVRDRDVTVWRKDPAFLERYNLVRSQVDPPKQPPEDAEAARAREAKRAALHNQRLAEDPTIGALAFLAVHFFGWEIEDASGFFGVPMHILGSHIDERMPEFQIAARLPMALAAAEMRKSARPAVAATAA